MEATMTHISSVKNLSNRKVEIRTLSNAVAKTRNQWITKNSFFYRGDYAYMRFLIPKGLRILELGCGTGRLINELNPLYGVGVDISDAMIETAKADYPKYNFHCGDIEDSEFMRTLEGPFDIIIMSDTIGSLEDCQAALLNIQYLCSDETRLIVCYYFKMWEPILTLARLLRQKMPVAEQNILSTEDIENLLYLTNFQTIKKEWRQLIPIKLFGLGSIINRFFATLPFIRRLCLRNYVISKTIPKTLHKEQSVSIVIPCRNERGNIESAIRRIPKFGSSQEIIFVEGHSQDDTLTEIQRVIKLHPNLDIKVLIQSGKGKGDAVRKGFEAASGDILMILDADLTTPPETLPKFYEAIVTGKGDFINGTRLVYPMQKDAMRFLNYLANHIFSLLFTWLLNQHFTDTLCGTKVLRKIHYLKIIANREYFGDFDPFGDFDLIFGAAKLNLKIIEIPIAYASREYGETQISRFKHGLLLLKMVLFAFRKLKAF
jgi:SAM-dependent methyltransferase